MLHHNIKKNEEADNMKNQCCRVCETTEEHDCCVDKLINSSLNSSLNSSGRRVNIISNEMSNLSAVFDKSTNTLTYKSWGHLGPDERINKAKEFRNIRMNHTDKNTKCVIVESEVMDDNRMKKM